MVATGARVRRGPLSGLPAAARTGSGPPQHPHRADRGLPLRRCGPHSPEPPGLLQRPAEGAFVVRLPGHAEKAEAQHPCAGPTGPHAPAAAREPGVYAPLGGRDGSLHPGDRPQSSRPGRRGRRVRPDDGLRDAASDDRDRPDDRRTREGSRPLQDVVLPPGACARTPALPGGSGARTPERGAVGRLPQGDHRTTPPRPARRPHIAAGRSRGAGRQAHVRRDDRDAPSSADRRKRDNHKPDRQRGSGAAAASRPALAAARPTGTDSFGGRRAAAVRFARAAGYADRAPRPRSRGQSRAVGQHAGPADRLRQPRPGAVPAAP